MHPELFTIPGIGWSVKSYGFMLMVGFLSAIWLAARRADKVKADPDMIINLGFVTLIGGVVGARLFFVIHYWDSRFAPAEHPILEIFNLARGGLEFYGGFIGGAVGVIAYLAYKRQSFRLYADIVAPSLMWGLALGRVGCFLNGCCWGGVCATPEGAKQFPWAVTFPYGAGATNDQWQNAQKTLPAELIYVNKAGGAFPIPRDLLDQDPAELVEKIERAQTSVKEANEAHKKAVAEGADAATVERLKSKADQATRELQRVESELAPLREKADITGTLKGQRMPLAELVALAHSDTGRSLPVHPTQLYAAIGAMLLSLLLSAVFTVRRRHGLVVCVLLLLYGPMRIVEEQIRVDNPLDTFGLTVSTGVSLVGMTIGLVGLIILFRLPERSPLADAARPAS